jgi:ATP-dependent DNA helicase RecQ
VVPAGRKKSSKTAESWEGVDRQLFEVLKQHRTEIARDQGVPPYIVFNDASLRDMARQAPTDEQAFLAVHGVGQKKATNYGETFMAVIREYRSLQEGAN